MAGLRVGVDIGGTFTDIVVVDGAGRLATRKVPSTVEDYSIGIVRGLSEALQEAGLVASGVAEVRHGTTIASNAILERKGARTGLITTKGFRDVLEIRTLRMPRLYDIGWEKPPPLIERYLRQVVDERIDGQGRVKRPLDPADAERAVDRLLAEGVEAIAICLINAYANPAHELMLKEIVRRRAPDLHCCISFEVLPEIKEYERTSTTVINTYVMPIVASYLASLQRDLAGIGVAAPLLLMQSNGGLMTAAAASERPMNIIESGPAGGVIGTLAVARSLGTGDVISFDMGGTTAKASLVEGGALSRSAEMQVGGGIIVGSRLLTGAGYTLKAPAIDLAEVGAGGGSVVWIDAGGTMQVGPHSAGAVPGPLCYGMGGVDPTVTDANLILGYINPRHLVGGALRLDAERAHALFEQKIARPLGLSLAHAAHGAHQIAASNMIRAIKAVTSERGRDPRAFGLFAFGGNGPLFAAGMARTLGIRRVLVPPAPGLFSSFGLLYAEVEYHYSRTFRRLLRGADPAELNAAWEALASEALSQLAGGGFTGPHAHLRRSAALHYQGQTHELAVPVPDGPIDAAVLAALEEAFGREHERTYGHRAGPDEPVEIVNLQVVGQGVSEESAAGMAAPGVERSSVRQAPRRAYFGSDLGWLETPVIARGDLDGSRDGPAIVEEYDATCVIPPGSRAALDPKGNIVIDLL